MNMTRVREVVSDILSERLSSSGYSGVDVAFEEDFDGEEIIRVYRALDHGSLKTAFKSDPLKNHPRLKPIGERVVELQSERTRADYLPGGRFYNEAECARLVQSVRSQSN